MEYLYVAASGIQASVFAEKLLQLNMILKKPLFLFESTGLTGLNCFKAGFKAGHFNRVLTRGRSGRPKFQKNKLCEDLWRNQKLYKIRNEIQIFLLRSLKKSFFGQKWPASAASGQIPIKTTGLTAGLHLS